MSPTPLPQPLTRSQHLYHHCHTFQHFSIASWETIWKKREREKEKTVNEKNLSSQVILLHAVTAYETTNKRTEYNKDNSIYVSDRCCTSFRSQHSILIHHTANTHNVFDCLVFTFAFLSRNFESIWSEYTRIAEAAEMRRSPLDVSVSKCSMKQLIDIKKVNIDYAFVHFFHCVCFYAARLLSRSLSSSIPLDQYIFI